MNGTALPLGTRLRTWAAVQPRQGDFHGELIRAAEEVERLERIEKAARAVHRARGEVFQISAPETMWGKLERLGEALRRG